MILCYLLLLVHGSVRYDKDTESNASFSQLQPASVFNMLLTSKEQ